MIDTSDYDRTFQKGVRIKPCEFKSEAVGPVIRAPDGEPEWRDFCDGTPLVYGAVGACAAGVVLWWILGRLL